MRQSSCINGERTERPETSTQHDSLNCSSAYSSIVSTCERAASRATIPCSETYSSQVDVGIRSVLSLAPRVVGVRIWGGVSGDELGKVSQQPSWTVLEVKRSLENVMVTEP